MSVTIYAGSVIDIALLECVGPLTHGPRLFCVGVAGTSFASYLKKEKQKKFIYGPTESNYVRPFLGSEVK
eukprot:537669-Amphidinium_carterae.1